MIIIISGTGLFFLPSLSDAQQNEGRAIITWEADNFFPSDFRGRSLPAPETRVNASVIVTKNGRVLDLSGADIAWYLDGRILRRSVGLQGINFVTTKKQGDNHFLRVEIRAPEIVSASVNIPTTNPVAIIDIPYPRKIIPEGKDINISAIPYFFNVNSIHELSFSWRIGGQTFRTEGDNKLILTSNITEKPALPGTILLNLIIQNMRIPTETTNKTEQLYVR